MHVDSVSFGESVMMGNINGISRISKMGSATPVNETESDIKISAISTAGAACICSTQYRGFLMKVA